MSTTGIKNIMRKLKQSEEERNYLYRRIIWLEKKLKEKHILPEEETEDDEEDTKKCFYCPKIFPTKWQADCHELNCELKPRKRRKKL